MSPLEEAGAISERIDAFAQRGRNESDPERRREYGLALSSWRIGDYRAVYESAIQMWTDQTAALTFPLRSGRHRWPTQSAETERNGSRLSRRSNVDAELPPDCWIGRIKVRFSVEGVLEKDCLGFQRKNSITGAENDFTYQHGAVDGRTGKWRTPPGTFEGL